MDIVTLSRLQFAVATMFHFLFVPLTLGLSTIVAYMETMYVLKKNKIYLSMTKFWGKLFLINFIIGVVTGITLEFQFGTNWGKYSTFVGDIFGTLLAIEASLAFFLESTFIGVWMFGWNRLSKKNHAIVAWLIAIAGVFSAIWILIANGWMQHPVGFLIKNGRAELTDFTAIITNKFAIIQIIHTLFASLLLSSFFVMGISAWHLLKKQNTLVFEKSFKIALIIGVFCSITVAIFGDIHGFNIAKTQPAKLAAMESHWETKKSAPIFLFAFPDEENETNKLTIGNIPKLLSFLAHHNFDAKVKGLKNFPKSERPPVLITFTAFRIMVGLGIFFIILTSIGLILIKNIHKKKFYLRIMLLSIPLPYIAIETGWILTEVGRQPWIVYGILKTSDAVSSISVPQVFTSLIIFLLIYTLLGITGIYLLVKNAKKDPDFY